MLTSCAVLLLFAQAPAATAAAAESRVEELWSRRDQPGVMAEAKKILDDGLAKWPNEYGLLWRAAYWYLWESDAPGRSNDQKSKIAKQGFDLAERAVAANPNDVHGHFMSATTLGTYALGIGVVKALTQGIEGRFRKQLAEAERFDPKFGFGAIPLTWGRYYAELPWPKRDRKKAEAFYRQAMVVNPANLRARVFLAELYLQMDRAADAKKLLDEVQAAPGNKYDPPEERRAKVMGTMVQQRMGK
jgi:tetratricopeptide (TPR) repeat protein